MKRTLLLAFLLIAGVKATAQQSDGNNWDAWRPLLGKWTAEGGGQPGQASSGGFTFDFDLESKVLIRRNYSEYPATASKPASRHEDLMMIYQEPGKGTRAVYFDNEGHVIYYSASLSNDNKTITFLSDAVPTTPRFRLIYSLRKDGSLGIEFDVAPPGKPDSFSKYVEGNARRK